MDEARISSLFSPVEIEGRLLVDGGVTNNYPIDEVRKLGRYNWCRRTRRFKR
jgi:NTE family protein